MTVKEKCVEAPEEKAVLHIKKELYLRGYSFTSFAKRFRYPQPSVNVVGREFVTRGIEPTSGAYLAIYEDMQALLQEPPIRGRGRVNGVLIDPRHTNGRDE